MKQIPKRLHIIWVGGDIPQKNRECIISHRQKSQNWEVNLWIDRDQLLTGFRRSHVAAHYKAKNKVDKSGKVTAEKWQKMQGAVADGGEDATIAYMTKKFGMTERELRDRSWDNYISIRDFCKEHRIEFHLVSELDTAKNFQIYKNEMVARGTNFGAASDILRIEILYRHGGVYVDTDVKAMHDFGIIEAHKSHPRFSAVHPKWASKGSSVTPGQWVDDKWWEGIPNIPKISNSIIASHAKCSGLKSYRKLITDNYKGLKSSDSLRQEYESNIRTSTLRMTGPTAAEKSSGYAKLHEKRRVQSETLGQTNLDEGKAKVLETNLYMRDNWWFPMFLVSDQYFHDWL